jgi:hypothetical protein
MSPYELLCEYRMVLTIRRYYRSRRRLRPWQALPDVGCIRCGAQATKIAHAAGGGLIPHPVFPAGHIFGPPYIDRYVCEAHAEDVSGQLCDQFGSCGTEPLRDSWRYYLNRRPALWIAASNLRFEHAA